MSGFWSRPVFCYDMNTNEIFEERLKLEEVGCHQYVLNLEDFPTNSNLSEDCKKAISIITNKYNTLSSSYSDKIVAVSINKDKNTYEIEDETFVMATHLIYFPFGTCRTYDLESFKADITKFIKQTEKAFNKLSMRYAEISKAVECPVECMDKDEDLER